METNILLSQEKPDSPDAAALIGESQHYLEGLYPPESQHGLSIEQMLREQVSFFILRCNDVTAGCGGVRLYQDYGEIKRLFVRPEFRGMGFARKIMQHLEKHALQNGIRLMRLETGIFQPEATSLYQHMGYTLIDPFGEYAFDPLSLFFEKDLSLEPAPEL